MAYFFGKLGAYVFNLTKKEATAGVSQKSIFVEHLRPKQRPRGVL